MVKHGVLMMMCSLLLCLTATPPAAAQADQQSYIKLQLDSTEVFAGDTVVLDVETTGLLDPIDYSLLEEQFDLIRETHGTGIAVIGGKVAEIATRRMNIVPKQSGVLVIGPLTAGAVSSNSVHLKVLDGKRPDWQPNINDLQIKTTITPRDLVVNQKALFTVELLHRYPINNESIELPDLNGFSKRILIENRRTLKGGNRDWFSTIWQYLIFPDRSGTLQIDSISWTGNTAKSRVERADFTRSTQALTVSVASPAPNTMQWWLPATTIQLTEEWSQPPIELRAGDELNRIIRVVAGSVLSGQIPTPVVPESRAVQQTLINTTRLEEFTKDNVISTAEFTYRVKAQSPIPVFLDTVRLPWWNTIENTGKEAIIPARRINVGLPDRADVLSKLALQETGVNRFKHWLQSTSWLRLSSGIVAVVCGIYLLWTLTPTLISHHKSHLIKKQHEAKLRSLADSGNYEALYQQLHNDESKLLTRDSQKKLMRALETRLFTDKITHAVCEPSNTQISHLLQDAVRQSGRSKLASKGSHPGGSSKQGVATDRVLAKF